jgi:type VI secretion system secreted protein Hcp
MELVAQGKTIPKATLQFMRADGINRIKYYELTLYNVLVSSNKKSFSGSGLLVEQFTLHYSKILESYTQQKIGGGSGGNTMGGWDLASNKVAA